jgi:hypothetical protein
LRSGGCCSASVGNDLCTAHVGCLCTSSFFGFAEFLFVLLVFFKNLNVVFVIGEHDFNSGFMKNFYIVWHLHLFGYFYVLVP